jgi:hypothetical protein
VIGGLRKGNDFRTLVRFSCGQLYCGEEQRAADNSRKNEPRRSHLPGRAVKRRTPTPNSTSLAWELSRSASERVNGRAQHFV